MSDLKIPCTIPKGFCVSCECYLPSTDECIMNKAYQQGRADRNKELADMVDSVNLDSNYLYICINRDKIKLPHFTYVSELLSWVKEQIKEQSE